MGIWFKKNDKAKWHLACYGGSIAQCGRNVHIAATYATFRTEITTDEVINNPQYCQSCVNSVLCFREYTKQAEAKYEATRISKLCKVTIREGYMGQGMCVGVSTTKSKEGKHSE